MLWPALRGASFTMPATIYLHWAATPYTWVRSGLYHTIISGDGRLNRLHAYSVDLPAHTYRRNSNSVALSCACMGGRPDPWTMPPTEAQLEAMCREVARDRQQLGLERPGDHIAAGDDPRRGGIQPRRSLDARQLRPGDLGW